MQGTRWIVADSGLVETLPPSLLARAKRKSPACATKLDATWSVVGPVESPSWMSVRVLGSNRTGRRVAGWIDGACSELGWRCGSLVAVGATRAWCWCSERQGDSDSDSDSDSDRNDGAQRWRGVCGVPTRTFPSAVAAKQSLAVGQETAVMAGPACSCFQAGRAAVGLRDSNRRDGLR